MSKSVKHNETERINVSQPFKGLTLGLYLENDVATAAPIAVTADLMKCRVTLKNKRTNEDLFSMPLYNLLYTSRDRYESGFENKIKQSTNLLTYAAGAVNDKSLVELGIDWDHTYHGDYELVFEAEAGFFPAGTYISSVLTVTPTWSDDPMIFEVKYDDYSLDKATLDEVLGDGIEEIYMLKEGATGTTNSILADLKRASIMSSGISESYNLNDLLVHSASFRNLNSSTGTMFAVILHDQEILSNCRINIEMTTPNKAYKVFYKQQRKNPFAEQSEAMSEMKEAEALSRIKLAR